MSQVQCVMVAHLDGIIADAAHSGPDETRPLPEARLQHLLRQRRHLRRRQLSGRRSSRTCIDLQLTYLKALLF